MLRCLMLAVCLLSAAVADAARRAPAIVLPEKYAAEHYARLQPYERQRCERYVNQLYLIEARKQLGALHNSDRSDMAKRAEQLSKDYDTFCLAPAAKLPPLPAVPTPPAAP
jgi:hypothetical protein